MIELPVQDNQGKEVDRIEVDEALLGGRVRPALLKQAAQRMTSGSARAATHMCCPRPGHVRMDRLNRPGEPRLTARPPGAALDGSARRCAMRRRVTYPGVGKGLSIKW